jgi:hypothetical protein
MRHAQSLVLRLLSRKFEAVPDRLLAQINTLTIDQLDSLGEALLDFTSIDDLMAWLKGC